MNNNKMQRAGERERVSFNAIAAAGIVGQRVADLSRTLVFIFDELRCIQRMSADGSGDSPAEFFFLLSCDSNLLINVNSKKKKKKVLFSRCLTADCSSYLHFYKHEAIPVLSQTSYLNWKS